MSPDLFSKKDKIRFWSKVDKREENECWPWTAGFFDTGYGAFSLGKQNVGAHRASFVLSFRGLAPAEVVRHSCHNRSCVNPGHLLAGSQADNIGDMVCAGRQARGSTHGRVVPVIDENGKTYESQTAAAKALGIDPNHISCVLVGRRTHVKGHFFKKVQK